MKKTRNVYSSTTKIISPNQLERSLLRTQKLMVFTGLGIILLLIGILISPRISEIFHGFRNLIISYNLLGTNSFLVVDGALGVPFINSGILVLCVVSSYILTNAEIEGAETASILMMMGFAFCGKTIFNVWPIIIGFLLHAKINHKPLSKAMCTAWFACSLVPIVNITAFFNFLSPLKELPEVPTWTFTSLLLAICIGILSGYIVGFFSAMLPKKHDHYTLYNVGFAAGISTFLIYSYLRSMNLFVKEPPNEYPDIANGLLIICALLILAYIGICGVFLSNKNYSTLIKIFTDKTENIDHNTTLFFASTLIHMSIMGFICVMYALLLSINMSGVNYAAFFTIVGFAGNGITLVTIIPLVLGVVSTSFVTAGVRGLIAGESFVSYGLQYATSKGVLVTSLFSCGMAPFVKRHGAIPGFIMASIHSVLSPILAPLQGWLNLYSTGFSTGLVATFYAALVERFVRPKSISFKRKKFEEK